MPNGIANTLSGQDVVAGDEALMQGLPPEALEAARALLQISSAPTPEGLAQAQGLTAQAFGPAIQQLQNQPAPAPLAVPDTTTPLGQFLSLLAANIAGTVRPEFAQPTLSELERQHEERQQAQRFNLAQTQAFRQTQATRGLDLAAKMSAEALDAAKEAGDDKAALEKALQLAKINDALISQRQREGIGQRGTERRKDIAARGAETRTNILLRSQERVKAGVELKRQIRDLLADSDLPPAAKLRLNKHAALLNTALRKSEDEPTEALTKAQQEFDRLYNEEVAASRRLHGAVSRVPAGPGPTGTSAVPDTGSFFGNVKARLNRK